jgi:hypothetical protein
MQAERTCALNLLITQRNNYQDVGFTAPIAKSCRADCFNRINNVRTQDAAEIAL